VHADRAGRSGARCGATALIAALLGCGASAPPAPSEPAAPAAVLTATSAPGLAPPARPRSWSQIVHLDPSGLRASLTLAESRVKKATDLRIRVALTNTGSAPYPYSTWFLDAASLRLQVRDVDEAPFNSGPPPMPREFDPAERHVIPPGGSFVVEYSGNEYFGIDPAPGDYEIRFLHRSPRADGAGAPIESEWVRFEIRP